MIRALLLAVALAGPGAAAAQSTDPSIVLPSRDENGVLIVPPEDDGNIIVDPEGNPLDGSLLEPDLDLSFLPDPVVEEPPMVALTGTGALVRGLDKLSGQIQDMELASGATESFGKLRVSLGECRYPEDNPSGDAFAYLVIWTEGADQPVFEGWMIASSPALNAMDHARYDVWVLRCRIS